MGNGLDKKQILSKKIPVESTEQGVYFLIQNDEIVYVGSSCDIRRRINTHIMTGKIPFDSFYFIEIDSYQTEEIKYIIKFNPKYNYSMHAKHYSQLGLVKLSFVKKIIKRVNHHFHYDLGTREMFSSFFKKYSRQNEMKILFGAGDTAIFDKYDMLKAVEQYYENSYQPVPAYQTFISFLEGVE